MVERPIKKSDLPPEETAPKTDRPERKENREEKKPPIPPALLRGPRPQPKKEVIEEVTPEIAETEELPPESN